MVLSGSGFMSAVLSWKFLRGCNEPGFDEEPAVGFRLFLDGKRIGA